MAIQNCFSVRSFSTEATRRAPAPPEGAERDSGCGRLFDCLIQRHQSCHDGCFRVPGAEAVQFLRGAVEFPVRPQEFWRHG
ncbi:MAG: hypothetical protein LBS40_05505, partial [Burkholderiales bacterium]|nr:hypothetical protein [Burkholderiales bacterium]